MILRIWPQRYSFARFIVIPKVSQIRNRSIHNATDNPGTAFAVARPLVFSPKAKSKHSIISLKGTASILEPKWAHLSPCIGAALSTSPFIRNLIKLASLYAPEDEHGDNKSPYNRHLFQTATLANHVFFQIMPESSLFLKRTKSAPAAYLTPRLIGTIVGQSILTKQQDIDAVSIQNFLFKEYGIRSNKIGDHWTGVSLNRWMDLFRLSHHMQPLDSVNKNMDWMPLSVWSVALWELSHEIGSSPQECWLEYLIECDAHVQKMYKESIFREGDPLAQRLKLRDASAVNEWKKQMFCPSQDLNEAGFEESMDRMLELTKWHEVEDWTSSLEVVCASIAFGYSSPNNADPNSSLKSNSNACTFEEKPVVPNGYFSVDEGDLKADCVEVTIREIIDLLLWNEDKNSIDLSRIPPNASHKLKTFYERLQVRRDDNDNFDVGKEWFDILSGLPGCEYLAVGKGQGIPYELAPTLDNVARVCHTLLLNGDTTDLATAQEWKSLEDIADGWTFGPQLHVQSDMLIHKDASSLEETKEYEIATLQVEGNPNCIEIRMRCDWAQKSGFSAVTHLKESRANNDDQKEKLWSSLHSNVNDDTNGIFERIGKLMALSQPQEQGLLSSIEDKDSGIDNNIELLLLELLSTRIGCDRRGIVCHTSQSDPQLQYKRQLEFDCQETKTNHLLIENALHKICNLHCNDSELCNMLLVSFLQESGEVVESSGNSYGSMEADAGLERKIASLPLHILSSKAVQQSIWNCRSGVIRPKILAACAELKSGSVSWWDVLLSDFSPKEVFSLLSLLRASKE